MKRYVASVIAATALDLGCVFYPRPARAHAQLTTTVQFDREIVHILDNHCVMCHMGKGVAFPLITYEQTYASRWKIRQDALERHMPPWAAVPGYGDFANSNALTQREIDFLVSWAESFGPRNNGSVDTGVAALASAPKIIAARFDATRWALGRPDRQLRLVVNAVPPGNSDEVRRTIIDPGLTSDVWLRGLEYKPGDRRTVHAVSFTVQETGQWLGSWTPWYGFVSLPHGLAYRLAAGSHIVAQIHCDRSRGSVDDQGSLGLYFADRASSREVADLLLDVKPAGHTLGPSRILAAQMTLATGMNILAIRPEIYPGVQSIEASAKLPDGASQVLLFARDISLEWPTPYIFARPIPLPKGTELSVIEHYASNAYVPVAGIRATLSAYEGTTLASNPPPARPVPSASVQHFRLKGTVRSVDPAEGRLVVQHGEIPGFMGAMTMSYSVGKHEDLKSVKVGDEIQSDVVVSEAGTYLEGIQVTKPVR